MVCPFCESENMKEAIGGKEVRLICQDCGFDMPLPDMRPDPKELQDEGEIVIDGDSVIHISLSPLSAEASRKESV